MAIRDPESTALNEDTNGRHNGGLGESIDTGSSLWTSDPTNSLKLSFGDLTSRTSTIVITDGEFVVGERDATALCPDVGSSEQVGFITRQLEHERLENVAVAALNLSCHPSVRAVCHGTLYSPRKVHADEVLILRANIKTMVAIACDNPSFALARLSQVLDRDKTLTSGVVREYMKHGCFEE